MCNACCRAPILQWDDVTAARMQAEAAAADEQEDEEAAAFAMTGDNHHILLTSIWYILGLLREKHIDNITYIIYVYNMT